MKADGIKAILLPSQPGMFANGQKIQYVSEEMRPFWDALAEADLAVCFHIGENPGFDSKGAIATSVLASVGGMYFRTLFGQLSYGGIFDNYPTLRVAFVEANLHWIPGMLQDAEMIQGSFRPLLDYTPKLSRPGVLGSPLPRHVHLRPSRLSSSRSDRYRQDHVGHRLPAQREHLRLHGPDDSMDHRHGGRIERA